MIFFLHFDDRVLVGGTDIVCGVGGKVGNETIGCREADLRLDSIPGTWACTSTRARRSSRATPISTTTPVR
jgi:hypothetical protein